ncbi:MAG TPA: hypothetical protein VN605_03195 [Thermoanaerobaculia bacterium]|nr:hypothetical protein [Thermoanaerobaculia bacterium]
MSRNRFARNFAVSMVAIAAVFAIPLMHCSTNTTPGTDTGARATALSEDTGGTCNPSSNPFAPIICIAADGSAMPNNVTIHSHNNNARNPVVFKTANGTGTLTISLTSCSQITLGNGCGNGPVCNAQTVTTSTGTCTYSASNNGSAPADPIIVTDNCCPASGPEPEHRPDKH